MIARLNLPSDAIEIVEALLVGIQEALPGNVVGVYLRGSIVMGEFEPEASDIDFFTVTERPVSAPEYAALERLHAQLSQLPNRYGDQLEGPYIGRDDARRYQPDQRHPTIARGEELSWMKHGENWMLERWTVREHGITLLGPDPKTLIDPVTREELRAAVRNRLADWEEWGNDHDDPAWRLHRGHNAYVVETMCRALCTLETGELPGKRRAVEWALETLPEPWVSTVRRSQVWHSDQTIDLDIVPEVRRFLLWATSRR